MHIYNTYTAHKHQIILHIIWIYRQFWFFHSARGSVPPLASDGTKPSGEYFFFHQNINSDDSNAFYCFATAECMRFPNVMRLEQQSFQPPHPPNGNSRKLFNLMAVVFVVVVTVFLFGVLSVAIMLHCIGCGIFTLHTDADGSILSLG